MLILSLVIPGNSNHPRPHRLFSTTRQSAREDLVSCQYHRVLPQGRPNKHNMALPSYFDDLLCHIQARTYDSVGCFRSDDNQRTDDDLALQLRTYLNSLLTLPCHAMSQTPTSASASQRDQPHPNPGAKQQKSVSFAAPLAVVHCIDANLCDYAQTRGIKPTRTRRPPSPRARRRTFAITHHCHPPTSHHRTTSPGITLLLPAEPSPIQWLPALRSLDRAVQSWMPRPFLLLLFLLSGATTQAHSSSSSSSSWWWWWWWWWWKTKTTTTATKTTTDRAAATRLLALGFRLRQLRPAADALVRAARALYATLLPALARALAELLDCLRALARRTTASSSSSSSSGVRRRATAAATTTTTAAAQRRETVETARRAALRGAEELLGEVRRLRGMVAGVVREMEAARGGEEWPGAQACVGCGGFVSKGLRQLGRSLDEVLAPVERDVGLLRYWRVVGVDETEPSPGGDVRGVGRAIDAGEAFRRRIEVAVRRCGDWHGIVEDLDLAYRMMALREGR